MTKREGAGFDDGDISKHQNGGGVLSPAHCLAGRAALGWSLQELAKRSGFRAPTIAEFEEGRRPLQLSAQVALQRALRKGGFARP
jgi:hypothetical protein